MPTLKIDITQVNNSCHKTKCYGSQRQIMFIMIEGCIGSLGPDDLVFQNAQRLYKNKFLS